MKKTVKISSGARPTSAQRKEIEDALQRKIVFDDESPEFSYEEMLEMIKASKEKNESRKKEVVTLRISSETLKKAKAVGKGYTGFLSRLIDNAINDRDLVSRSL